MHYSVAMVFLVDLDITSICLYYKQHAKKITPRVFVYPVGAFKGQIHRREM